MTTGTGSSGGNHRREKKILPGGGAASPKHGRPKPPPGFDLLFFTGGRLGHQEAGGNRAVFGGGQPCHHSGCFYRFFSMPQAASDSINKFWPASLKRRALPNGRSATCCRRQTTPVYWYRSRRPGRPAGSMCITVNGWLSELLAQLEGKTPWQKADPPRGLRGQLRAQPVPGLFLALFFKPAGFWSLSGRRYGIGQNHSDPGPNPAVPGKRGKTPGVAYLPHLPDRQLAKGSSPLHTGFAGYGMVISSYSLLHRDIHLWQGVDWAGVILDEAQNGQAVPLG